MKIARSHILAAIEFSETSQVKECVKAFPRYLIQIKKFTNGWNLRYFSRKGMEHVKRMIENPQ